MKKILSVLLSLVVSIGCLSANTIYDESFEINDFLVESYYSTDWDDFIYICSDKNGNSLKLEEYLLIFNKDEYTDKKNFIICEKSKDEKIFFEKTNANFYITFSKVNEGTSFIIGNLDSKYEIMFIIE